MARGTNESFGKIAVVKDLFSGQLRCCTEHAAATNTKLLLPTTSADGREPAHTLITALAENLPWAKQLGAPDPSHRQSTTSISRAGSYLDTLASAPDDQHRQAAEFLARCDQLIDRYRDLTRDTTEDLDRSSSSRGREHDNGLKL